MDKRKADYARLKDQAEVQREGYHARVERAMAEINKLLKGHQELVKVAQLIDHYAVSKRDELDATERVMRYDDLLAKQNAPAKTKAAS